MDFFTGSGDAGDTGLLGKERISKASLRIEVIGCLDETNAALGIVRSNTQSNEIQKLVLEIQRLLYQVMTEVAATEENAKKFVLIKDDHVLHIEQMIYQFSGKVEIPKEFIVPGDTKSGAFISFARTLIRKSERRMTELFENDEIKNIQLLRFLNRLSSLFFVLELYENQISGIENQTLVK